MLKIVTSTSSQEFPQSFKFSYVPICSLNFPVMLVLSIISVVARPGPTRACALPSTFQALPSAAQHDSRDSISN